MKPLSGDCVNPVFAGWILIISDYISLVPQWNCPPTRTRNRKLTLSKYSWMPSHQVLVISSTDEWHCSYFLMIASVNVVTFYYLLDCGEHLTAYVIAKNVQFALAKYLLSNVVTSHLVSNVCLHRFHILSIVCTSWWDVYESLHTLI